MSPEEREQIKAEIMAELKEEIRCTSSGKGRLQSILDKWFKKPSDSNGHSLMFAAFGSYRYWKAWDDIRRLTCLICGTTYVSGIVDREQAEEIADSLCQTVYDLRMKYMQSKEDATN